MWPLIALSLAKFGYDKYHENLNRQAEATKERYAPFTGYQSQDVKPADLMGDLSSGAVAGMQMDQAKAAQTQNGKLSSAMEGYYNRSAGGSAPAPSAMAAAPGGAPTPGGWPSISPTSLQQGMGPQSGAGGYGQGPILDPNQLLLQRSLGM